MTGSAGGIVTVPPLVDIQPPFNEFTTAVGSEWQPVAQASPTEVFAPVMKDISPPAIPSQMTVAVTT